MGLNAYLIFDGDCEAAFKFYEQVLGGKIEAMVTSVGTPMEEQVPLERRNKIVHGRLVVGDGVLMGMERGGPHMQEITPCLWFDDRAEEAANFYVSVFSVRGSGFDGKNSMS